MKFNLQKKSFPAAGTKLCLQIDFHNGILCWNGIGTINSSVKKFLWKKSYDKLKKSIVKVVSKSFGQYVDEVRKEICQLCEFEEKMIINVKLEYDKKEMIPFFKNKLLKVFTDLIFAAMAGLLIFVIISARPSALMNF